MRTTVESRSLERAFRRFERAAHDLEQHHSDLREKVERLEGQLVDAHRRLEAIAGRLTGDPVRAKLSEAPSASVKASIDRVTGFHWDSTQAPTATQRAGAERAASAFEALGGELATLLDEIGALTADLDAAGAPWTPR